MSNQKKPMRIFFAGSSSGMSDSNQAYKQIIDSFEDLGHEILPSWIVNILRDTGKYSRDNPKNTLQEQQDLVRRADLMVVECQRPSFGIGFLMHLALQERVPILCLYPAGTDTSSISDMIAGNSSSLMYLKQYDKMNIKKVVADFYDTLKTDDLHKFNFVASREVLDYIEQGAKQTAKSKSEFLRDEITKIIRQKS